MNNVLHDVANFPPHSENQYSPKTNQNGAIGEFETWEDIINIESKIQPIQISLFPPVLSHFIKELSLQTETPLELPAALSLGALSIAAMGKFQVETDVEFNEPVNLYIQAPSESGTRKSSTLNECKKPIEEWENQKRKEIEPQAKTILSKRRNEEAQIKNMRASLGKGDDTEDAVTMTNIEKLESNLSPILRLPRKIASDLTPERMASLMCEQDEQIGIMSDEAGLLENFAGRYNSGVVNLDLLLKGYDGSSHRVDRQGAEPIFLSHPLISVVLCPQPSVLRSFNSKPEFRDRGFTPRFIYFMSESTLGNRTGKTSPISKGVRSEYENMITKVLEMKAPEKGSFLIKPSTDARRIWKDFWLETENKLKDEESLGQIKEWGSKLPGTAARIAALFHIAENYSNFSEELLLSSDTMLRATSLAEILQAHALKAFDIMSLDSKLDDARHVLKWIQRKSLTDFTQCQCHKALQSRFQKVAQLESALEFLEERNYIKKAHAKSNSNGRPKKPYLVNPQLKKSRFV